MFLLLATLSLFFPTRDRWIIVAFLAYAFEIVAIKGLPKKEITHRQTIWLLILMVVQLGVVVALIFLHPFMKQWWGSHLLYAVALICLFPWDKVIDWLRKTDNTDT